MEIASTATPGALRARLDAVGVAVSGPVPDAAQVAVLSLGPLQSQQESTEDSIQLLPPETRFPNVNSLKNRMRFKLLQFGAKHKTIGRSSHETWQGVGDVAIEVGNSELVKCGVVLLDSQSKDDLISTRFASKFHLDFDGAAREPHALTVTGHTVYSVGTIHARWYAEKSRSRLSFKFKGPTLWRFIEAEFRIIDSDQFDVIIGSRTINDHKLFERKGLLAPFRELIIPSKDNEEQERLARERREQAAKRRDQHEQVSGSGRK